MNNAQHVYSEHEHAIPVVPTVSLPSSSASSVSAENAVHGDVTPTQKQNVPGTRGRSLSRQHTIAHSPSDSFSSLYGHPAATRAAFVQTAQDMADMASARSPSPIRPHRLSLEIPSSPSIPAQSTSTTPAATADASDPYETTPLLNEDRLVDKHENAHSHGHGHAHGSMNMRALLLHVFGDALGNVGVIATGLVIWQTTWRYKYYFDPLISLVITVIIFSSALPLGTLHPPVTASTLTWSIFSSKHFFYSTSRCTADHRFGRSTRRYPQRRRRPFLARITRLATIRK